MKLFTLSNYILASHAFLGLYLLCAFSNNDNFYAAMQSLAVQKPAVVAIYNYCFILFLGLCELVMMLFFGQLRHMEVEQVVEQGRGFFMDAVLFLVLSKPLINGREIDTLKLLKCLCCLIALKGYHLVLFIRSLHIFQTGIPKLTTILRNLVVMYILTLIDISLIFLFYSMLTGKSTFYMWLLFECIGMFQGVLSCILKYAINLADIILIHGLSQKPTYLFYLDLIHDLISLIIFIGFMTMFFLLNPTSLPLYMVVDVMQVIRNLAGRMTTLFKYRKLTKIIELRFPNATPAQAEAQDTCIICREKLDETCKSLDCSHVFHYQCLKSWLIHQISCPLCRKEIVYLDPYEVVNEMYATGNTEILFKKIIETDINRDPFEEFNLFFEGNIIDLHNKINDNIQLNDDNKLKETYQSMIVSVDSCINLINKFNSLDSQSPGFESALEVISLDQFERYILLSQLADVDGIDVVDENILSNIIKFEKNINLPLKYITKPYMASILGYRMRVIDSMVRAVKSINSDNDN